ncbi:MAG: PD40 domain-containing protein [Acidobacteriaceae bacterium]|nr:PD40 domain-containing protein [Acidobacteriaceae bacterium]MBV9764930.1 PD40 domain-containing protein [Acidobacteriaceae bacterium]
MTPKYLAALLTVFLLTTPRVGAQSEKRLLFRNPSVSQTQIVFEYANDLWTASREGGEARRLTSGVGREFNPHFSPDGKQIAFSGEYDGNIDVYVVSASGGVPRRLTYHPGEDVAIGWTPDGKRVLFNSHRDSYADSAQLYTIGLDGTLPEALPLPAAEDGSYSGDGSHIAYAPVFQWEAAWKRYRGGQTTKIWIADLADSSIVKIPRENSNDFNPMWVGDKVYFLSDRSGPVSLWVYDTGSRKVSEAIKNSGLDFKSASAGGGAIVYEEFGSLNLLDLKSGHTHPVDIRVAADLPEVRPRFEKLTVAKIENSAISPTGQRALFEAHGEILTVPAEKGDVRNLTSSPSVADRDPAWSPDGKWVAYFSDESGEYALHIRDQSGLGEVKKIDLGNPPSFFYSPVWSPDSKKISYTDKRLNLWYVDLENKTPVRVETDLYDSPGYVMTGSWSPDSRWLAYSKQLQNHLHAIVVYSLSDGRCTQVTDGMSDATSPTFDKSGKYLYFLASTNVGLSGGWIDMSSIARPVTSSAYVMVLRKDLPSPLAPESDEENKPDSAKNEEQKKEDKDKGAAKDQKEEKKPPPEVRIDFENIGQRILAVPVPDKNYLAVSAGKEGVIYLQEVPIVEMNPGPPEIIVNKFDFKKRKTDTILTGATVFKLSNNGEKMLFRQGEQWVIAGTDQAPKAGEGALKLADMEVYVDPRAEWRQMYHEVWRIERDFFYDPHFHGLDLHQAEQFYKPYVDGIATRADLNYLFEEMLGNMTVGHMFVRGGTEPEVPHIKVGLLGADYKIENGRYRFAKVYNGENWNPQLQAPLTQPGVNVVPGEYLLAVRGREVRSSDNVYSFFQETAGKQIVLKVGPNPDGTGSREVTVVPVDNEHALRHLAWVEGNRRKVDQLSGGKLAYVHLPDTAHGGYTNFNRYFFAQVGRQGAVLDERFNHGGDVADYIIDYLNRRPMARITTREGEDVTDPEQAIYGPKVMIINQFAGSGGDAMPWYFRKAGVGPLVGEKTWGGLIGIGGYPPLIDGGRVTAPRWAFYGLSGEWEVENRGIAPDIEVDLDPKLVREGHDPQLERAVAVAMELLEKNPPATYQKPAYPNYHQRFEEVKP